MSFTCENMRTFCYFCLGDFGNIWMQDMDGMFVQTSLKKRTELNKSVDVLSKMSVCCVC